MLLGSAVLEVAIGVLFVYLLLSFICSSIKEAISNLLALRSDTLEKGIRNLLGEAHTERFYNHALVKGLAQHGMIDQWIRRAQGPAYIPARTFALTLLDVLAPEDRAAGPRSFDQVRAAVAALPNELDMKQALLVLLDEAEGDLTEARHNIEAWFNTSMDRVSAWYKRKSQVIIFALAIGLTLLLNLDTIMLVNALSRNAALRATLIASAESTVAAQQQGDTPLTVADVQTQLSQLGFPVGWTTAVDDLRGLPVGPGAWIVKVVGLLITGAAVSLGAPFYFDLLGKLVTLRGDGQAPPADADIVREEARDAIRAAARQGVAPIQTVRIEVAPPGEV